MLIDTHAHLNFNTYKSDADEVIRRSFDNDVWLINVGSQYETSKRAVEIAERHEKGVYAVTGLHPIHLATDLVKIKNDPAELPSATHGASTEEIIIKSSEERFDYNRYKELARSEKVVAIGEIGLDYYWKPKTKRKSEQFKNKQKEVFLKQLDLAKELNLPVIFHCRLAHDDLLEILSQAQNSHKFTMVKKSPIRGVIHCFTGNWEQAKKYLEMGLYLGFNGIIFKKIEGISFEEVIKYVPLDRILLETDCPYLTPPPMSGRNEPLYLKYIAEQIAKIKNVSFGKVAEITTQNARNLFQI